MSEREEREFWWALAAGLAMIGVVVGLILAENTRPACPAPSAQSWLDPRPMGPAQSFERAGQ